MLYLPTILMNVKGPPYCKSHGIIVTSIRSRYNFWSQTRLNFVFHAIFRHQTFKIILKKYIDKIFTYRYTLNI